MIDAASAINAFSADPFAAAAAINKAKVDQDVQTAVAVKQRDVQKAEGQAVLQLLDSASVTSKPSSGMPGFTPGKGLVVDLYA
ncbi:MAG: hypothetical protein AAF663_03945 [Planctomycetota bacterium]